MYSNECQKAEVAAQKAAVENAKKAAIEDAEWSKGSKSSAKKSLLSSFNYFPSC